MALTRMVGGLLAGLIFKRVWKLIGRGDAPKPTDERRGWGEILLAAVLQGAIFALVKAAADRGAAEGTRRLTGIWPGDEGQQPDERPDHHQPPPPAWPTDRGLRDAVTAVMVVAGFAVAAVLAGCQGRRRLAARAGGRAVRLR